MPEIELPHYRLLGSVAQQPHPMLVTGQPTDTRQAFVRRHTEGPRGRA